MCVCVCVRVHVCVRERQGENEVEHSSRKLYKVGIISYKSKMHNMYIKRQPIHTIELP